MPLCTGVIVDSAPPPGHRRLPTPLESHRPICIFTPYTSLATSLVAFTQQLFVKWHALLIAHDWCQWSYAPRGSKHPMLTLTQQHCRLVPALWRQRTELPLAALARALLLASTAAI